MINKTLIYIALIGFTVFSSCKKDETKITVDNDKLVAPVLSLPANNADVIITKDNLNDSITFSWKAADYTMDLPVTYALEIDSANVKTLNLTSINNKTSVKLSLNDINKKVLGNFLIPANVSFIFHLKVVSKLDNGQLPVPSERLTINLQTYKKIEIIVYPIPGQLFLPGSYQASGGDPTKSDVLSIYTNFGADSLKIWEGFVNIPKSCWIKFTPQQAWTPNWGGSVIDGKNTLVTDGPGVDCPEAGLYSIRVDSKANTYKVYEVKTIGIIGDGTPGGWDKSTPMTYDAVNMVWKVSNVALTKAALKFRANDEWTLNFGPTNANELQGTLKFDDPGSISVPAAGNYDVIVDFSKSKGKHDSFTYSLISLQ